MAKKTKKSEPKKIKKEDAKACAVVVSNYAKQETKASLKKGKKATAKAIEKGAKAVRGWFK